MSMMIPEEGFSRQRVAPSLKRTTRGAFQIAGACRLILFEDGDTIISFAFYL